MYRLALPILALVFAPHIAYGQTATTAEKDAAEPEGGLNIMITQQRRSFLPPDPVKKPRCQNTVDPEEIVVCRRQTKTENYRVNSSITNDPRSRNATRTGALAAPNVSGMKDCTQVKCRTMGKAPAPVYYFDITALPKPPAGSDADKISKGEMASP